jgi:peptidoglycan hydrolase CwlO-like protein
MKNIVLALIAIMSLCGCSMLNKHLTTKNALRTKVADLTEKKTNAKKDVNKLRKYINSCDEKQGKCSKKMISKYARKISADLS